MRVLILGAGGMLGHKVWQLFRDRFDCRAAVRRRPDIALFDDQRVIEGLDATNFASVERMIGEVRPEVVVNCVGVIKQIINVAHDPIASITINSLFPHIVARACADGGARMIQISTDCVFSGARGHYSEFDNPDPTDLYGRSKLLGESRSPMLTLRTSIIGRELRTTSGLVEWFLAHRSGKAVHGYTRALFSGVTTNELARILATVIERHGGRQGLYHVAAEPISKYDLLVMINEAFGAGMKIAPDDSVIIDRTLDATRFRLATGLVPPPWREMIAELAAESRQYEGWRTA